MYADAIVVRADDAVGLRRRRYSDHFVTTYVCVWGGGVCLHNKTKNPDRNDLKFSTVVPDSLQKPIDFGVQEVKGTNGLKVR